jgi:hypothetical protein
MVCYLEGVISGNVAKDNRRALGKGGGSDSNSLTRGLAKPSLTAVPNAGH